MNYKEIYEKIALFSKELKLAHETEKVRTGFYIEKEVLDRCYELLEQANAKSRNEFVMEALKFYCGYLTSQKIENYLLQSLSSVLISTIRDTENRLARMDFKIATELSKFSHVVVHTHMEQLIQRTNKKPAAKEYSLFWANRHR